MIIYINNSLKIFTTTNNTKVVVKIENNVQVLDKDDFFALVDCINDAAEMLDKSK